MVDWRDLQDPGTGRLPNSSPAYTGMGGPAWGGIVGTLPRQLYLQYGDERGLKNSCPAMKKCMAYLDGRTEHQLLRQAPDFPFLAGWAAPGKISAARGIGAEAAAYRDKVAHIARPAHELFFKPDKGIYVTQEMPYPAFPLPVGLVPRSLRGRLIGSLEKDETI